MLVESRRIRVYAAYYQFHVKDEKYEADLGDFWTEEAVANRTAVLPGIIGIGTASYDIVDVVVEIHSDAPLVEPRRGTISLRVTSTFSSGGIQVIGCLDSLQDPVQVFAVSPGNYRVRCCHANLAAASVDGVPDRPSGDWYLLQSPAGSA